MATTVSYGGFQLNDQINFYTIEKPFDEVSYVQMLQKVARMEGMKKSGESVDARTIQLKVKVVGVSRADLETQLSTMHASLAPRQQQLQIYALDSRYYIADATVDTVTLAAGLPTSAIVSLTFVCQQPYAYGAVQTYDTGQISLSGTGTHWFSTTFPIVGMGNIFSRPTIRVYQQGTAYSWTLLSIFQTTDTQTITITTNLPTANGDFVDFFCDPVQATTGWTIQKNDNGVLTDFTGQFPVMEYGTTNWSIQVNAPFSPQVRIVWSWTPRYLP